VEFNALHAAVMYMGPDKVILRPYLPGRSADSQDIAPYFCECCGVLLGPHDEYLSKFVARDRGFRLFAAVVQGPELPKTLPGALSEEDALIQWVTLPKPTGGHVA
jgi:hypothetical protein